MNIGRLIRTKRQKLGYRMNDLADENISRSTISKIERNEEGVSEKKINYYLSKLNTTKGKLIDELAELVEEDKQNTKYLLDGAETILDLYGPDGLEEAEICLQDIDIDSTHPEYAKNQYLLGKIFLMKQKHDKAIDFLRKAGSNDFGQPNVRASAWNDLALIANTQNNIKQALTYIDQGLEIATKQGKRNYIYHQLLTNKALLFIKIGKYNQTSKILDTLWQNYHLIEKPFTRCHIHYLQALLYIQNNETNQAIKMLNKGIELARISRIEDMSLTLWTTLGQVLSQDNRLHAAEKALLIAIKLGQKNGKHKNIIKGYLQLGYLYIRRYKWQLAFDHIRSALRLAERYNDMLKVIDARIALGELHITQKQFDLAAKALNEAFKLANQYDYLLKQHQIVSLLAKCHRQIDKKKYHEALALKHTLEEHLSEGGYDIMPRKRIGDDPDGA